MDGSARMTDVQNRWVFSSELPPDQRGNHLLYDPGMSDSAQRMPGLSWSITYADGSSASGNVYNDTVDVGGAAVLLQPVELAQQVSDEFVTGRVDGVLGLAFRSLNQGMSSLMFAGS